MNGQANNKAATANSFWAQIAALVVVAVDLVGLAVKYVLVSCAAGAPEALRRFYKSMSKQGRTSTEAEAGLTRPRRGG